MATTDVGKKKGIEDVMSLLAVGNSQSSGSGEVKVKVENPLWQDILKCKDNFSPAP